MRYVVFLITKGGSDYHGIGLVKVVWKVETVIINSRFRTAILFHDMFHGLRVGCGIGTVSLKAKLLNKLTNM